MKNSASPNIQDSRALRDPAFDLDSPGTVLFSSELALKGHRLNKFALSLRNRENQPRFRADETAYMRAYGISESDMQLVRERDWSALLLAGGHLQAILKIAATVGQSLWHIGAHNVGIDAEAMKAACPRVVAGLPEGME